MLSQAEYADLHTTLSDRLERIATLFRPGVRLTLIVRQPGNPDGTTYLSDDNVDDVLSAINYTREKAVYVAGPAEPERDNARGGE